MAIAFYLGGDAVNGRVEDGRVHYLFGYAYQLGRGDFTWVTKDVFTYSRWHAYSLVIGAFVCAIVAFVESRLRSRISALGDGLESPKEPQIESEGVE